MTTLKECLIQTDWKSVGADLEHLFSDQAENIDGLHHAYNELVRTEPDSRDLRITIGRFAPNSVLAFYVVGFNGNCPKGYCLKFIPWRRWLGGQIDPALHREYRYSEIAAICLYDMCWAGFSAEDVESFRREFIYHENCLQAIFGYDEMIKDSEPDPIRYKQRSNEFNEALNLYDLDQHFSNGRESHEYRRARFDMEVQVYCLGETETDYDGYCAKVAALKENFHLRWPDPNARYPHEH